MKIFIEHGGYKMLNFGDLSMLLVAHRRLKKLFPSAVFYIPTCDPEKLEKYFPGAVAVLKDESQKPFFVHNAKRARNFLRRLTWALLFFFPNLFKRLRRQGETPRIAYLWPSSSLRKTLNEMDLIVAAGGGYLNDSFVYVAKEVMTTLHYGICVGKVTAALGQGLGPVTSKRIRYCMKSVLRDLDVLGLREGLAAPQLLKDLGLETKESVFVTGDDALELLFRERPISEPRTLVLGVNLRIATYAQTGERELKDFRKVFEELIKKQGARFAALPISAHASDSDVRSLGNVFKGIEKYLTRVESIESENDFLLLLSECNVVLSGSYHAAVYALAQGIPVIGLVKSEYYADKFKGLAFQFGEKACQLLYLDQQGWEGRFFQKLATLEKMPRVERERIKEIAREQIVKSNLAYEKLKTLF